MSKTRKSSASEHPSMRGFVCWQRPRVEQVMQVEALQERRSDFLAVHRPPQLWRRASLAEESTRRPDGQDKVLRDFLTPSDFAFVPVVGDVGTGKSHLINWMWINLPKSEKRRVLLIPKINTNLRSVLLQIVEGMEGEPFDSFRARISGAAEMDSDAVAAERLLNELAVACGRNSHPDPWPDGQGGVPAEQADYFKDAAPPILLDPVFRRHLLADGGAIPRLVAHAFGRNQEVVDVEQRQQVTVADLPQRVTDFARAGKAAQEAWECIRADDETKILFVAWLNANVNAAVRRVLNLRREDLAEVMLELRRELNRRGQELVFLIEDFAKQQGIERELLESLLVHRRQGGEKLCPIRTALACTSGYFRSLQDTVGERVSFYIDLDPPSDTRVEKQADPAAFASRYLNAVRLGGERLDEWHAAEGSAGDNPPSHCDGCEHRKRCHADFGEVDGYGLYPFNRNSLSRLSRRESGERFNPRKLVINVLKRTLWNNEDVLRRAEFPPPAFGNSFAGTGRLDVAARTRVLDADSVDGERRAVLLDLWSDWDRGGPVPDLPDAVHEAFGLPKLGTPQIAGRSPATTTPPPPPEPPKQILPAELTRITDEVNLWAENKAGLSQAAVQSLRNAIFTPLDGRIGWDGELMLNSDGGRNTLFEQRHVNFEAQSVRVGAGHVSLSIPTPGQTRAEAAYGCQGLLLFAHHKSWRFDRGGEYQRRAAGCLEAWSAEVLRQVRQTRFGGKSGFDPVPAAAELLALGQRLLGRPAYSDTDLPSLVDALFEASEDLPVGRGDAWSRLCKEFAKQHAPLVRVLRSRLACTKGQSQRLQMIDAARLVEPLRRFRRNGWPVEVVPDDLVHDPLLKPLAEFRAAVDELLPAAVEEERQALTRRAANVVEQLGAKPDLTTFNTAMTELAVAASHSGIIGAREWNAYENARAGLRADRLQDAVSAATKAAELASESAGEWSTALLDQLSRNTASTLDAATDLLVAAEAIVAKVEDVPAPDAGEGGAARKLDALKTGLSELHQHADDVVRWAQDSEVADA